MTDWEKIKELLTAIDARLRAFTDREVVYYLRDELAVVKVSVYMMIPKLGRCGLLELAVSKLDLPSPWWNAERIAQQFVYAWTDKMKFEQKYAELDVRLDYPPSWASKEGK